MNDNTCSPNTLRQWQRINTDSYSDSTVASFFRISRLSVKMEHSLSSLAFRGTIAEAIAEAKLRRKLFVVYTAGHNPESKRLETSSWIDPNVSETLAKYCIFLHILEGSAEASYFAAIYPQNYAPCITAIGYNGVLLWQKEGFVSADILASSLEKAWLSLHVQDTTAAFLTATLTSGISGSHSSEHGTSEAYGSSLFMNDHNLSPDAQQPLNSETIVEKNSHEDACKGTDSKVDGGAFSTSPANVLDSSQIDESNPTIETEYITPDPVEIGQNKPEAAFPVVEKSLDFCGNRLGSGIEAHQDIIDEASAVTQVKIHENAEVERVGASDSPVIESNCVFLNIRMPDGFSLQANFSTMDTLRIVNDYINDNKTSNLGSFNLAIPYPRHVFTDKDLDSTLSELGLFNRHTLIVISHGQSNSNDRGSSVHYQANSSKDHGSSSARNEGYWTSVKRILSYVNPLSYLSGGVGSTSASEEFHSGVWQHSPNSSLQNNPRVSGGPTTVHSTDQITAANGRNNNSSKRQQTSGYGGNIHTLKHDEDHNGFDDRNAFWNGNSTQYGGNHDGK